VHFGGSLLSFFLSFFLPFFPSSFYFFAGDGGGKKGGKNWCSCCPPCDGFDDAPLLALAPSPSRDIVGQRRGQ
jgi:hypothetical protein